MPPRWGGRSRRRSIRSHGEAETARIARELAAGLAPGSIVLLFGELGVGKTAFVRGLLEGAGGAPEDVSSPTFTLIQQYAARLPVAHVDLYRLSPAEVDDLGLDELASVSGIVAIEWADRLPRPPGGAIRVHIEDGGGDTREIRVEHPDASPAGLAPQGAHGAPRRERRGAMGSPQADAGGLGRSPICNEAPSD